jgi:hypothetical protein
MVRDVAAHLENAGHGEPIGAVVAECNAALEGCLEAQREARDRDEPALSSKDELRRLARLLTTVDRADLFVVMRQIRRVLARFDSVGA